MSKTSLCKTCRHFMHRRWTWSPESGATSKGDSQRKCKAWEDALSVGLITEECNQYEKMFTIEESDKKKDKP